MQNQQVHGPLYLHAVWYAGWYTDVPPVGPANGSWSGATSVQFDSGPGSRISETLMLQCIYLGGCHKLRPQGTAP